MQRFLLVYKQKKHVKSHPNRGKVSTLKLEVNRDVDVDTTVSPSTSIDL